MVVVTKARIAFGGMAATPRRAPAAEAALTGRAYDGGHACARRRRLWREDFAPITDLRATAGYRMTVAKNLLMRDFLERTAPDTPTRLAGSAVTRLAGVAA